MGRLPRAVQQGREVAGGTQLQRYAATTSATPVMWHGPSHAARIGQRRRHTSYVARQEQQWARQQESVAAAHAVRLQRIEQLRKALLTGNVASMLRPPASEAGHSTAAESSLPPPISAAQASRVTTQGWVVVRYYEELDAIELGVLDGSRSVTTGGVFVNDFISSVYIPKVEYKIASICKKSDLREEFWCFCLVKYRPGLYSGRFFFSTAKHASLHGDHCAPSGAF